MGPIGKSVILLASLGKMRKIITGEPILAVVCSGINVLKPAIPPMGVRAPPTDQAGLYHDTCFQWLDILMCHSPRRTVRYADTPGRLIPDPARFSRFWKFTARLPRSRLRLRARILGVGESLELAQGRVDVRVRNHQRLHPVEGPTVSWQEF